MNREEALLLLECHAFAFEDIEHEKMTNGFLGMLRPFGGQLVEENFHEVMTILDVLSPELTNKTVSSEMMACLWSICHLGRAWAVEPDGMLRSNGLITAVQTKQMEEWLSIISYAVMILLEDGGAEEAFWGYEEYKRERNK
ncbi:hypothetical protein SAMN04487969_104121 [Paenibacillus algorifonticola]|uniref:Uncharacterized protein n=1 Tax=Paenibacillus algorifonticola TaxID=684063 RepID=A0A1I2BWA4_9BACL|nr:hypothetical protein [Paenibacillus algorifonticola]SFE60409.1 hypothetical protein SAMN04487969_104121 [Paenibacillus algorifonticola]